MTVTVETTPWSDFQTKAFAEFNAKGDAYDMVVGDCQWLGAGSTGGHYVDLTDFFDEHKVDEVMAPATVKYYAEYDGKYWAVPVEGDANGWAYRKDWFEDPAEMAAFKAKYGYDLGVPKNYKRAARHRRVLPPAGREPLRHRDLHRQRPMTRWPWASRRRIFTYGGDLGDYATDKVDGIINSPENVEALEMYRELYQFTPPNWGKAFFLEDNQAITEGLAAMSMNYFAFFPALANPATNPHAEVTGYFANPPGPNGEQHAALGGQGISIVSYSQNQEEALKFLEWFIREDVQKQLGRARRLHRPRGDARVGGVPQRHARTTRPSTSRCSS